MGKGNRTQSWYGTTRKKKANKSNAFLHDILQIATNSFSRRCEVVKFDDSNKKQTFLLVAAMIPNSYDQIKGLMRSNFAKQKLQDLAILQITEGNEALDAKVARHL